MPRDSGGAWRSSAEDYGHFLGELHAQRDSARGYGQKALEEVLPRPNPVGRARLRPPESSESAWVRSSDSYGDFLAKDSPASPSLNRPARQPEFGAVQQVSNLPRLQVLQGPSVLSPQREQREAYLTPQAYLTPSPSLQFQQQQEQLQQLQYLAAYQQQQLQYLQAQLHHQASLAREAVQPPAVANPVPPALDRAYYQAPYYRA
mmetsp:Transcript_53327/g.95721  ORF Transcript_53327/g.95721 Transcript_53327/m.95721 type:complete len:204 (+) Transcript_53327:138-749(+)